MKLLFLFLVVGLNDGAGFKALVTFIFSNEPDVLMLVSLKKGGNRWRTCPLSAFPPPTHHSLSTKQW